MVNGALLSSPSLPAPPLRPLTIHSILRFRSNSIARKTSEVKLEQMFKKYDTDQSGYIEYAEFKKIWVRMANIKKELTDRGVKIPKITTNRMLYTMLEQILDAEEDRQVQGTGRYEERENNTPDGARAERGRGAAFAELCRSCWCCIVLHGLVPLCRFEKS